MKNRLKYRIAYFISALILIGCVRGASIKVGEKAPDFTLMDQDSTLRSLSDFRGKKVVVYFFPKADTPG